MDEAASIAANQPTRLGERRQVSVLFADMVGYTAIVERLGEERALPFARMIYDRLTGAVREHGGAVRGFAGDSVMAVFGIPEAQEDAALRACRAALAIQCAFAEAADEIEAEFGVRPSMRAGVSSGITVMAAVEGEGAPLTAVGHVVNLASRVQNLASAGGCLMCDATRRQVEWRVDMSFDGEHAIKGVARPQKLWRLLAVREGATRFDASRARGLSQYVGRDSEFAAMSEALQRARHALCVVDLVAEPGLGKTRLVHEFLERAQAEAALVLTGQCSTDGQQTPFLPFLEVVRASFRIRDGDEPGEIARKLEAGLSRAGLQSAENHGLLLNLLGLRPPEGALAGLDGVLIGLRTRDLLPALLKAQCDARMVVLRLEDIHWMDGASEGLMRTLIEGGAMANLLIVHTRRPEYSPPWRDLPATKTLALKPLAEGDIRHLALTRLGVEALPEPLIRQLTERAGGNPLFGEEILSFLVEQGALRIHAGKAEFDADQGENGLPVSMQSLLTARMERLQPEDRALLQAAAAIGRRFDPALLSLVVERTHETGEALQRLESQDIVRREVESSDYAFKHVLLRDCVYQGLVAARKAELHLAIAGALERRNEGRLAEAAETLAYHYTRTGRTDLAFTYSALAGKKSLGVYSLGEASQFFASALALREQDPACASDEEFAAALADYALGLNISLQVKEMIALADKVGPFLNQLGDNRHHVLFLHHHVSCLLWNGRYRDALGVRQELSAMAARLGDPQSLAYARVSELAVSCYCAPLTNEVFEAKRREADADPIIRDDAYLQNFFLAHMGWNEISRGRVAEARQMANRMIVEGVAMKDPRSLGYGTAMKALIAMVSDDHTKALKMSEEALSVSRAEFERAIAAAAKAAVLVPLGRPGAADAVRQHVALCEERGWTLFLSTPELTLGVALVIEGRIAEGLEHIETVIARRETEGYQTAADWYRLLLCEIYLEILSGKGRASPKVVLQNFRSLARVMLFGKRRIAALVEQVRANPQFDPEGLHIARSEMILGLLHQVKRRDALARDHLTRAWRIVDRAGASPMLTRIETALAGMATART